MIIFDSSAEPETGYIVSEDNHVGFYHKPTKEVTFLISSGGKPEARRCKLSDWCKRYIILADNLPQVAKWCYEYHQAINKGE